MQTDTQPKRQRGKALTETEIKRAKQRDRPYRLNDTRGLFLLVNPNGSRWWRVSYTLLGRRNNLSLGIYPDVTLDEARCRRDDTRRLVAHGVDPAAKRREDKAASIKVAANRFEGVAREWLGIKAHEWVPAHVDKETLRLTKHVLPWIGDRPIAELGVDDLMPVIRRVFESGHLEQAHRLREQLSRIFRYAIATGRAKSDPAHALSETLPMRNRGARGYPSITDPMEIGELLRAMDGFTGTFSVRCALRLAPYLFCRPGELRKAEWTHSHDLDGQYPEYRVPPSNRKLRRHQKESPQSEPHIVPMSRQALAILGELRPLTGHRTYLFPGARDPKRCMSEAAINAALARIGYKGKIVGHGFRHMASTRLEDWCDDRSIEAQLSHKVGGVRGKYKRQQYLRALAQRRDMMQQWADYLDTLKCGESKVVAMRAA